MTPPEGESAMPDDHQSWVEDMLADPIVRALMAADGVRADDVRALMRSVAEWRCAGYPAPMPKLPGAGSSKT